MAQPADRVTANTMLATGISFHPYSASHGLCITGKFPHSHPALATSRPVLYLVQKLYIPVRNRRGSHLNKGEQSIYLIRNFEAKDGNEIECYID